MKPIAGLLYNRMLDPIRDKGILSLRLQLIVFGNLIEQLFVPKLVISYNLALTT